jgi:itaconate CoA-transferase
VLPLEGITVVALEQAVAAPFATRQLADLGARVIKIERPVTGDFARGYDETVKGMSSYFVWLNRGKESVTLDIKDPGDRAVLDAMLARADVFVQNLLPGTMERLGLGEHILRATHPRLITCSISGYGSAGPYRSKKAYDLLVQCEAGLLSVTGTPDSPAKAGISVADISAGMYAYTGVLTALYERERTGAGTSFEVAMLDALGEWSSQPYLYASYSGTPPPRTGARHASISPYGPYQAGDGGQVFIGVQNEREWAALCSGVLGQPHLAQDPRFARNSRRAENDAELRVLLEEALSGLSAEQVTERLDEIGIANARLRTMREFAEHPQLAARDRWREVDSPAGPVRSLLPPVTVTGREAAMGAIPALGEHTDALRAEFTAPASHSWTAGHDRVRYPHRVHHPRASSGPGRNAGHRRALREGVACPVALGLPARAPPAARPGSRRTSHPGHTRSPWTGPTAHVRRRPGVHPPGPALRRTRDPHDEGAPHRREEGQVRAADLRHRRQRDLPGRTAGHHRRAGHRLPHTGLHAACPAEHRPTRDS